MSAASLSVTSSPDVLSAGAPVVTYHVTVSAETEGEVVVLESPVALLAEGPATVTALPAAVGAPAIPACPDGSPPAHAASGPLGASRFSYQLSLPGSASEVFTGHGRVRSAPWPEDLVSELTAGFALLPAPGRPPITTTVAPVPRYDGPLGVRIVLTGTTPGAAKTVRVRRGSSIVISGRVFAPLTGETISLLARGLDTSAPQLIARTPVRPDGTIAYRWHPLRAGRYRISAVYAKPRAGYARDRSDCALTVEVRRQAPAPERGGMLRRTGSASEIHA